MLWTVVTGLVDAYSYLVLGRVFVANMTGNVVFVGFALGGAPGFTWWASILAICAFIVGAFTGGKLRRSRLGNHRAQFLAAVMTVQLLLMLFAMGTSLLLNSTLQLVGLVATISLLSTSMGLQNASARAIAVPDLTTTVLTLTITGLAGDGSPVGEKEHNVGRRLVSILAMAFGAFVGAGFIVHDLPIAVLIMAVILLSIILWRLLVHSRDTEEWVKR
ncbi:DUF1275 domain-containing protein [Arcanobacterium buesumense]|uniref:DUF1275 domain-containing protein n=1 Tax=Arcanobacterium buesumense TaxID=2722751 RepID=A0A6H2ENJ3_9ACTO|nr:DUF1275 domain-containing protein [Arcanobacterium buesumense]